MIRFAHYLIHFYRVKVFFYILFYFGTASSVLIISIPKAGTHLVDKAVKDITLKINNTWPSGFGAYLYYIPLEKLDFYTNFPDNTYLFSHLRFSSDYFPIFLKKKIVVLLNLRDPRDQSISLANWIKKNPGNMYPSFIHVTYNEVLVHVIEKTNTDYEYYLPWMNYPYALTVRFEDLVGSKGGGDDAKQLATVKAIAKHVSVELTEERAQEIATDLFGITKNTFRKGQIGAWKHEFTAEHKELFKQYGGELLIKLGYEKDLNW